MNSGIQKRGFTLIELLVVVAIISVLMGLLLPAVQMARESARNTNCSNKLRQITLASLNYESAKRRFPKGYNDGPYSCDDTRPEEYDGSFGKTPYMAVLVPLLPFIEEGALWDQTLDAYEREWFPYGTPEHIGFSHVVPGFVCASSTNGEFEPIETEFGEAAITNYLGVCGTNYQLKDGLYCLDTSRRAAEIKDGLSNTLAFGERPTSPIGGFGWWYCGYGGNGTLLGTMELNAYYDTLSPCADSDGCPLGPYEYEKGTGSLCDTRHFWSYHIGGCNFSLADGSIRFIAYEIDNSVFAAAGTIKGGEVYSFDE